LSKYELEIIDKYINNNVSISKSIKNMFKVWLNSGLLDNEYFYQVDNSPLALYFLLRNNEIRGKMKSPLNKRLKREYFENGHIVCGLSYSQIEKKTGWYRSMISRRIDTLKDRRWIRIDRIDVGKKEKQNIYLLGRINLIGDDSYFLDEIINSSQK